MSIAKVFHTKDKCPQCQVAALRHVSLHVCVCVRVVMIYGQGTRTDTHRVIQLGLPIVKVYDIYIYIYLYIIYISCFQLVFHFFRSSSTFTYFCVCVNNTLKVFSANIVLRYHRSSIIYCVTCYGMH